MAKLARVQARDEDYSGVEGADGALEKATEETAWMTSTSVGVRGAPT